jgi:hypothetical protein
MIFMFVTTVAALIYTSYNLFSKVLAGKGRLRNRRDKS